MKNVDKKHLAALFNRWMKDYTENPEKFLHEWQEVERYLTQVDRGDEVTYGDNCVALLDRYDAELAAEAEARG